MEPGTGLLPLLRATNINGELNFTDTVYVPASLVREEQHLVTGDIVVAASSGSLSVVGKAAPLRSSFSGTFGAFCFVVRPIGSLVCPTFLSYFMQTLEYRSTVSRLSAGVNINNLKRQHLEQLQVPFVPLPEQHRIVKAIESYLSRLDDAVATLERVQRNLKRYRASVLKAAVEGRLVPTEAELARQEGRTYEPASALLERILEERRRRRWKESGAKGKYKEPVSPDTRDLPELPEGWCWASCGQLLLRLQTGPFGSSLHKTDYVDGGTPVINPQHLTDYRIMPFNRVAVSGATVKRLSGFQLASGDIVLGRRGEMGRCAIVGSRENGWLLGTGSLSLRLAAEMDGRYCTWLLRSPQSVRILEGESVGTTMTNLNQKILLSLPVALPPAMEQARVADEVERQFSVVSALETGVQRDIARCTRLRQAILKWAFEGKLVDQDPTDEPASALLERIAQSPLTCGRNERKQKSIRQGQS